jgi:hypothetical protein
VKMEAAALTQSTSRFPESRRPQKRTTMGWERGWVLPLRSQSKTNLSEENRTFWRPEANSCFLVWSPELEFTPRYSSLWWWTRFSPWGEVGKAPVCNWISG